jgi:HAD superfamily hydrolase (TIGR01450 family)
MRGYEMDLQPNKLRAVILDVDGVIWISGAPGHGAADLLSTLRRQMLPFCLLTNDCSVSKTLRHAALAEAGLPLRPEELVTASEVTNEWLREVSVNSIMYLGAPGLLSEVARGITVKDSGPVDVVVVGDLFNHYDRRTIDGAVKAILAGAKLVAMQHNRRWSDGKDWYVDNGFWVAGFEYVTDCRAFVMGKPNPTAYLAALRRLGDSSNDHSGIVLVSDDTENDLKGAKAIGLTTVYFGQSRDLAEWVDFCAQDFSALKLLLGLNINV